MSKSIDDLKTMYDDIPIPDNLNFVVSKAIKRGRKAMKIKKTNTSILKTLTAAAAVLLTFIIALNASPVFANSMKQLPGGETIVRLLTFVGDTAIGGEITDGQDIKDIQVEAPPIEKPGEKPKEEPGKAAEQKDYYETLTVNLHQGTDVAAVAGHFTVTQKTHPHSIEVYLAGVRAFSAADAFPDLSEKKLFDNIYRLVTLDDSAHRFVVTFKKPVSIEVSEQQNPARLIIKVRKDAETAALAPMYSLRTVSLPFGEVVGVAENIMKYELGSENARLLMDDSGLYLAEEGLYATLAEAEARLAELKQAENFLYEMRIEKREAVKVPGFIEK